MTRLIGIACRKLGARLVCLGMRLSVIGCHLAPRRPVVACAYPTAWTSAHEGPRQNAPAIGGRN